MDRGQGLWQGSRVYNAERTGSMAEPTLSALVVAHNEAGQLAACLEPLRFADELVVVLDKCTDASKSIAESFGAVLIEGSWPLEGPRRRAGIEACRGPWILEIDADERVPPDLAAEIRAHIANADPGCYGIPILNHIGGRAVVYGWGAYNGVSEKPILFTKGMKRWGDQRVHPKIGLFGARGRLRARLDHHVDADLSDMIKRFDRYTTAHAIDLLETGDIGTLRANLRRIPTRFWKAWVGRKGYKEGRIGLALALFAALYPIVSHLKAWEIRAREDGRG